MAMVRLENNWQFNANDAVHNWSWAEWGTYVIYGPADDDCVQV